MTASGQLHGRQWAVARQPASSGKTTGRHRLSRSGDRRANSALYVSQPEQEAMIWLRDAAGDDDTMVTNAQCRAATVGSVYCDSRTFWVTGLSGVMAVLESWAYTPEALALQGEGGRSWVSQPSPWPEQLALTHELLDRPTPSVVDELVRGYSADWVVVVRRYGSESADVAEVAEPVFDNGEVAIYRLPADAHP